MPLQNSTNGNTVLYKAPITGTFGNSQVPSFSSGSGTFIPGSGGGGTWGSIGGSISAQGDLQTALNAKQNTITTGNTSQYLRGNLSLSTFASDTLAVTLTGLTSTTGTLSSTDSILNAFGKTLYGLAAVNTRIDNLAPPNTGFFNGGENASASRTLGNTTNFGIALITNNTERLSITKEGAVNIWSANRYAVPNNFMSAGSLTIGNLNTAYGNGSGWNSNTAQVLLECNTNTEIAANISGIGVFSLASFEYTSIGAYGIRRMNIGRNMNWGRTHILRNASNSLIQSTTSFDVSGFIGYLIADDRPNITIGGNYPHFFMVASGNSTGSASCGMKMATIGSDNITRHFNQAQINDGKYIGLAYYEGTDYNPHNNTANSTGTIHYIMPGYSTSNNLSSSLGMGLNIDAPSVLYHLHIRGTGTGDGTIGWGLNDGCRTELKNNASASDRLGKQSGFFRTNTSPANFFSGASWTCLLIDCRLDDPSYGLQIAGNHDNDDVWTRKLGRPWYKMLSTYSGWSRTGNDLSANTSDNLMGSTSAHDVVFIAGNVEFFRLSSGTPRSIQVNANGYYGTSANPNYAFRGNYGENVGMYYKASGVLSFATNAAERLQIDNGNAINSYLPFNLAGGGGTQEIRMGGTRVLGTRKAALTASNTATISTTTYDSTVAAVINNLRTRLTELEDRLASTNGHGLFT